MPHVQAPLRETPMNLRFHVDRRIVGEQRAWLEEARVTLEEDTHGVLRVFYDYDFDSTEPMVKLDGWQIVYISRETPVVGYFDDLHKTTVLGECDWENRHVYLVQERLTSRERFIHVVMHELLHSVGVHHIKNSRAIMAPIAISQLPLHMTSEDLDAFCQTVGCSMNELRNASVSPSGGFSQWVR